MNKNLDVILENILFEEQVNTPAKLSGLPSGFFTNTFETYFDNPIIKQFFRVFKSLELERNNQDIINFSKGTLLKLNSVKSPQEKAKITAILINSALTNLNGPIFTNLEIKLLKAYNQKTNKEVLVGLAAIFTNILIYLSKYKVKSFLGMKSEKEIELSHLVNNLNNDFEIINEVKKQTKGSKQQYFDQKIKELIAGGIETKQIINKNYKHKKSLSSVLGIIFCLILYSMSGSLGADPTKDVKGPPTGGVKAEIAVKKIDPLGGGDDDIDVESKDLKDYQLTPEAKEAFKTKLTGKLSQDIKDTQAKLSQFKDIKVAKEAGKQLQSKKAELKELENKWFKSNQEKDSIKKLQDEIKKIETGVDQYKSIDADSNINQLQDDLNNQETKLNDINAKIDKLLNDGDTNQQEYSKLVEDGVKLKLQNELTQKTLASSVKVEEIKSDLLSKIIDHLSSQSKEFKNADSKTQEKIAQKYKFDKNTPDEIKQLSKDLKDAEDGLKFYEKANDNIETAKMNTDVKLLINASNFLKVMNKFIPDNYDKLGEANLNDLVSYNIDSNTITIDTANEYSNQNVNEILKTYNEVIKDPTFIKINKAFEEVKTEFKVNANVFKDIVKKYDILNNKKIELQDKLNSSKDKAESDKIQSNIDKIDAAIEKLGTDYKIDDVSQKIENFKENILKDPDVKKFFDDTGLDSDQLTADNLSEISKAFNYHSKIQGDVETSSASNVGLTTSEYQDFKVIKQSFTGKWKTSDYKELNTKLKSGGVSLKDLKDVLTSSKVDAETKTLIKKTINGNNNSLWDTKVDDTTYKISDGAVAKFKELIAKAKPASEVKEVKKDNTTEVKKDNSTQEAVKTNFDITNVKSKIKDSKDTELKANLKQNIKDYETYSDAVKQRPNDTGYKGFLKNVENDLVNNLTRISGSNKTDIESNFTSIIKDKTIFDEYKNKDVRELFSILESNYFKK